MMAKERKLKVDLIERTDAAGGMSEPYRILFDLLRNADSGHEELLELNFYMVWKIDVKEDADNNVLSGEIKFLDPVSRIKTNDDVQITLNHDWWVHPNTTLEQKQYCIDDLLSQIRLQVDEEGEYVRDQKGRAQLRKRKHPVRVFPEVEARYSEGTNVAMRQLSAAWNLRQKEMMGSRYQVEDSEDSEE